MLDLIHEMQRLYEENNKKTLLLEKIEHLLTEPEFTQETAVNCLESYVINILSLISKNTKRIREIGQILESHFKQDESDNVHPEFEKIIKSFFQS